MKYATLFCVLAFAAIEGLAQDGPEQTLITNVHVFDGINEDRIENANVLIEGNLIKTVSTSPIEAGGATVIDGGGRTLIPGLIDAHYHPMLAAVSQPVALAATEGYINLVAARNAEQLLLQGFTTVRDVGGNPFSIKLRTGGMK